MKPFSLNLSWFSALLAICTAFAMSVLLKLLSLALGLRIGIPVVVRNCSPLPLIEPHGNLNSATSTVLAAVCRPMLPVLSWFCQLGRNLDMSADQGKVVLLCPSFLQAVLALELLPDFRKTFLRLGSHHHSGCLLVESIATTSLHASTYRTLSTCAGLNLQVFLQHLSPKVPCAESRLIIKLERQVLVNLDSILAAVQQLGRRFRTKHSRQRAVDVATVPAGEVHGLIDTQELVRLAKQLRRKMPSSNHPGENEVVIVL
mmetsp:Transcript_59197/g.138567  ORF Transcript_59197/g.138567 Transcript_59197/m.138567 type:complete len:259 (+) Transcript_59197:1232-2008(+)